MKSIMGDKRRYQQILINFLSNALKFSKKGSQVKIKLLVKKIIKQADKITIQEGQKTNKNTYYMTFVLSVRDYGMGVPSEKLKHLFLNFRKIEENSIANKNGVGLGLSICKNLIEQMGGSVKVRSEVGQGAQFDITLHTECIIDDIS
jgi:signal transduction histidine kinase